MNRFERAWLTYHHSTGYLDCDIADCPRKSRQVLHVTLLANGQLSHGKYSAVCDKHFRLIMGMPLLSPIRMGVYKNWYIAAIEDMRL